MLDGIEPNKTIDLTSDTLHKGAKPNSGTLVIGENGKMRIIAKYGKYCIEKNYNDESPKIVDKEECRRDSKVTIVINGSKQEEDIGTSTRATIDLTSVDILNATNVSCNNGTVPTLENNTLTIDNIMMDATCYINDSLESTVQNLDDTEITIVLSRDISLLSHIDLYKNPTLDLNGYIMHTDNYVIINHGKLVIQNKSDKRATITSLMASTLLYNYGELTIEDNCLLQYEAIGVQSAIYNKGKLNFYNSEIISGGFGIGGNDVDNFEVNVYSGKITARRVAIRGNQAEVSGKINIYGGILISTEDAAIDLYSNGIVHVKQTNKPIYITSLAKKWASAVCNKKTGTIYIEGEEANQCTANAGDTTDGLCIYAEGDKNYGSNTANGGVANQSISGGTIYGGNQAINNTSGGIVQITGGKFLSSRNGIFNYSNGTIKLRKSTINAPSPLVQGFSDRGYIYYNESVIWNNDGILGGQGKDNIILDESLSCNW